jgi:hypothetical protein
MRSHRLGIIAFTLIMLLSAITLAAQRNDARATTTAVGSAVQIQPPPANYAFPYNETYIYSADWRIWTGGTVALTMIPGAVSATANSTGFVSMLYPVHDQFQSTFDPKTFCSQSIRKHTEEGYHARDTMITFDYAQKKWYSDDSRRIPVQMRGRFLWGTITFQLQRIERRQ